MTPALSTTPAEALEGSRLDVIAMIRDGIPPREYVPGAAGLLPKSKRVHIAAEKKTGKSLAITVVTAIDIVAAGGTVRVLDRENGGDEYARRLGAVLDARNANDAFRENVRDRLHYHAWPTLQLGWRGDPHYPAAFGDDDVVIFDSTRSHLTPLNLSEDESDDFAAFVAALIDPLMQAGKTTITLDNTGHSDKERARGTSAKEDLCDIAFTMKRLAAFSSTRTGRLELRCLASRLGEIDGTWTMELGNGRYGSWEQTGDRPPEVREDVRKASLEVLRAAGGTLGVDKIGKAIRARPGNTLTFSAATLREGLAVWAAEPGSGVLKDPSGKGYLAHVGPSRHGDHVVEPATRLDTGSADAPRTTALTADMPTSDSRDTARRGVHAAGPHPLRGGAGGGGHTREISDSGRTGSQPHGPVDGELQLFAQSEDTV